MMKQKQFNSDDEAVKGTVTEKIGKWMAREAPEIKGNHAKEVARSWHILEMSRKRSWLLTN
jgi:hypothetical protein